MEAYIRLGALYVVLAFAVLVHELGHLVVATIFGIKIDSISFGLEVFSKHICTLGRMKIYASPLLLGANVKPNTKSIHSKKKIANSIVVLSGPAANFLIVWIALGFSYETINYVIRFVSIFTAPLVAQPIDMVSLLTLTDKLSLEAGGEIVGMVAIMNTILCFVTLFPFPMSDGEHIIFDLLESMFPRHKLTAVNTCRFISYVVMVVFCISLLRLFFHL